MAESLPPRLLGDLAAGGGEGTGRVFLSSSAWCWGGRMSAVPEPGLEAKGKSWMP